MNVVEKLTSGLERKYRLFTILSPFAMVGEVLMETTIPLVMARIVDVGVGGRNVRAVAMYGALMVSMALFSLACGVGCGRLSSLAAFGFSRNLRRMLFGKVQSFSFRNIDKFGTGALVTRLTTDVTNVQNIYQGLIRTAVRAPLMLVFGTVMACVVNLRLACIFFAVIPVLAVILSVIASAAYPRFRVLFGKYDRLNTIVQENLIAMRVVKSFVRGDFEREKFDSVAVSLRDAQVRAEKIVILNVPVMQIVIYSCIVSALWFGGNMVVSGSMTTGGLISFLSYITQILMSLMMLSMMFVQFILSRASVSRICEVLDEVPAVMENGGASEAARAAGGLSVEFDDVSFSYSEGAGKEVLSGISVSIPAGATVGIIGGTGSSKSTLVQLIPRLYDVSSGSVRVGGIDVRDWRLGSLRKNVAVVLQKSVLFSGTIAENMRWGNEDATDSEIEEACAASDAHSFVSALPDGYGTVIGQGGVNLSGGQRQRLCIARALLKKPAVLILDDSTSAVDTATDLRIRGALRSVLPGATKIIIAQRIASVADSDFIVVMDGGRVCGIGTHEELLAGCAIYREVYESQMSGE